MSYKKVIAAIVISLLCNSKSFSLSLANVVQSTSTTTSPQGSSRVLIWGYRACQAIFWLTLTKKLIKPFIMTFAAQQISIPLDPEQSPHSIEFLKTLCSENGLNPAEMNLLWTDETFGISGGFIESPNTIVLVQDSREENLEEMLKHEKNNWQNISLEQQKREKETIDALRCQMTHEIAHLKKHHMLKRKLVTIISLLAMSFFLEKFLFHKGYLKNWFSLPNTTFGLLKPIVAYGSALFFRNWITDRFIISPYICSQEREADAYAIERTQVPKWLEATANSLENLYLNVVYPHILTALPKARWPFNLIKADWFKLGSFGEKFLLDPTHPAVSERITYFRAAAKRLQEKQRMHTP